ncbi:MAG: T9SS type A sorting domain-containing protein [Bacteroidia bacterium]
MKKMITLLLLFMATGTFAQVLLNDDFNYSGNDSLSANGWTAISGITTNAIRATASGLTYTGYPGSNNGAAAAMNTSGQDVYKDASSPVTTGNVFVSFMMKVNFAQNNGDYFFALLPSTSTSTFNARLYIKSIDSISFLMGISKTTEALVYNTKDTFYYGVTYLVALKHAFHAGADNDTVSLYVFNGGVPAFEPPFPTARPGTPPNAGSDLANVSRVALRQGSASNAASLSIDGIRFGTNWADVVKGAPQLPPAPQFPAVMGTGQTTAKITWAKPAGYIDSSMSTLVFLKKGTPVAPGSPVKNPVIYTPNTDFSIGGTAFELDTAAKCVMNSDSGSVNITGLSFNTTYHAIIYIVRNKDSAYSMGATANGSTFGASPPPAGVKLINIKFTSPYAGDISFVKDSSYHDSTFQILVFMKRFGPVFTGTPKKPASAYTANTDFSSGSGTMYEFDSMAYCVHNSDSAKFSITGLTPYTKYHFLFYVIRGGDTAYSSATHWTDSTPGYKPQPATGMKFSNIGMTSAMLTWNKPAGYIDSLMTTLIFVKAVNNMPGGYLSQDPATFMANSHLPNATSPFPLDSAAMCVFNADSTKTMLTGLNPNTMYYAVLYAVRKADSNYYSPPLYTNSQTLGVPPAVLNPAVMATGQTSVKVNWNKPFGYNNTEWQTIVFVKQTASITQGSPTKPSSSYTANSDFSVGGSPYEHDASAKCAYNGDSSSVEVTGLLLGTNYHVLIYIVRNIDSAYSSSTIATGSTFGFTPPPPPLVMFGSTPAGGNSITLNWVKDSMYVDSTHTVLIFAKKGNPINPGKPIYPVYFYHADSNFAGTGQVYELDSLAKCVYYGDGVQTTVIGLEAGTSYHFVAFVVRDADTAYSSQKVSNAGTAFLPPAAVSDIQLNGVSMSITRVNWTKPAGYFNSGNTTVAFMKAGSPVNAGKPTKPASAYNASSLFGLGAKFEHDTDAFAVYRGDTNFVSVSNLKRGITYHVVIFNLRDGDTTSSSGATGSGTVLPQPSVYPLSVVASTNPTTGLPDSNGVRVRVRGVTYGYNQRATGLQFVIRDQTGGTTLFRNSGNLGYTTYAEGDSVEAEGMVTTFRGLAEVSLDTIIVLGNGKALKSPTIVSKVAESGENDLLRIDTVAFITPPSGPNWPTSSSNYLLKNTNNDTIVLRVLNVSPLAGTPLPATPTFSVIGLGVQFSTSSSAPFAFNGYQLFPRTAADIIPITMDTVAPPQDTLLAFNLMNPTNNATVTLQGDTASTVNLSWTTAKSTVTGITALYAVVLDTLGGDFSSPVAVMASGNSGSDTTLKISLGQIASWLGLSTGQTFAGQWMVGAIGGSYKRGSDSTFRINFTRGQFNGLEMPDAVVAFEMYPNPAREYVQIIAGEDIQRVWVTDQLGRKVCEQQVKNHNIKLSTETWPQGVYFVLVETNNGTAVQKLQIR